MATTTYNQPNANSVTKQPKIINDILAIIFGALLTLAFAPFNIYAIAILSPALLLLLWSITSPKRSFLRGWLFGLGFFSTGMSWVYVSIHTYGQAPMLLAGLITIIFIMVLASFIGLTGYILARFFPKNDFRKYLLAFPALWVICEWIREWLLTGFPWLYLGYTQITTPLRGLAPIFGVYGISWAVAFTSGVLVYLFIPKKWTKQLLLIFILVFLWIISGLLANVQWTKPINAPIKVTLLQGNIPQEIKWDPQQTAKTLQLYYQLTQQNLTSNIILWPEAAITVLSSQAQIYLSQLNNLAKAHHLTLITGIPIEQNNQFYNGMIALGNGHGTYLKRHLVPFGEFMPFRWFLNWLRHFVLIPMSDFSSGPEKQADFMANNILIAPFICYEIAYPSEVLAAFPAANLIVVLTDDSWFGDSFAPAQHIQMAQMRALETGRYLLSATNNGVTAIINPQGQMQAYAQPFQQAVLTGEVQAMTGSTPLMWWKNYSIIILLFVLLFLSRLLKAK